MSLLAALFALAAPANGCAALVGREGTVVVDTATPIVPAPRWTAESDSSYRPRPVSRPLCRVQGRIEGNIGFDLWMPVPVQWNGRLLAGGVGGDAGQFNHSDMARRLEEGFATFSTDSGHKKTQSRWMADAKAREDYAHRATHLTTVAVKRLVRRFYGRSADRSYFLGCSGGGRQGLKELQEYPRDFDGIVAGAPGPYMPLQSVRMMWFALQQKRNPAAALTDADWSLYENAVTHQCDAIDDVGDGIVADPRACRFDTRVLECKPGTAGACLTAPKRAMLDQIIAPLRDESGRALDGGLLPGVRTRPGPPSPLLRAMWADAVYDDPDWDEDSFRRTADLAAINRIMPQLRADSTRITPFVKAGGKAILYQGWADPSTNAGPTTTYYQSLAKVHGAKGLSSAVRLFMVPGMYHCQGGPGADGFGGSGQPSWPGDPSRDILWAVIHWVERGIPPVSLVATKQVEGTERFRRLLCPFPQVAQYDGRSDPNDAASYRCVADASAAS